MLENKLDALRYSWVVECRSHVEHGARPTSTIYRQMYNKAGRGQTQGNQIRMTLPYIRTDIPVIIVFRALGWYFNQPLPGPLRVNRKLSLSRFCQVLLPIAISSNMLFTTFLILK